MKIGLGGRQREQALEIDVRSPTQSVSIHFDEVGLLTWHVDEVQRGDSVCRRGFEHLI